MIFTAARHGPRRAGARSSRGLAPADFLTADAIGIGIALESVGRATTLPTSDGAESERGNLERMGWDAVATGPAEGVGGRL